MKKILQAAPRRELCPAPGLSKPHTLLPHPLRSISLAIISAALSDAHKRPLPAQTAPPAKSAHMEGTRRQLGNAALET